ncbi:hypothetical protein [Rariglobus hedericola]|uniref:Uncharacterized protein n=1 Tax=Rariglobus hedericola TaxID=2597822 RepID=A0A556QGV8_9BACT|nr:hypothetical protein [Rariglobus hedericola]TSJ75872.1 hypothetical protein FPL22_16565 [Rariglobus hedericola]
MKPYLRVTLVYAVFGILWIFLSDQLVALLANNLHGFTLLQTMKGWLFVALSSLLVFVISRAAFKEHIRTEREKQAVFQKTVEGSYHILLNYLNQMQLVTMEAEQCEKFSPEILHMARAASGEAEAGLKKLGGVHTITADHIDAVIYENIRKRDGAAS